MVHENDGDTVCYWYTQYSKGDPNYSIVEIGQNTEKSPEDLLSLKNLWKTIN